MMKKTPLVLCALLFVLIGSSSVFGDDGVRASQREAMRIAKAHELFAKELRKTLGERADAILTDPRLTLTDHLLTKKTPRDIKEIVAIYRNNVLRSESVEDGIAIAAAFQKDLIRARKNYGVDPYTIVSILRVETTFGTTLGAESIVNSLYTLYVMREDRRKFAFTELIHFIAIADREGRDPFEVKGSWAGAFGLPQFIPSSYRAYAVDGDGDGKVDLFGFPDAIASVANYLSRHGWKHDQRRAILRYNNWGFYADLVTEYALRVRSLYAQTFQKDLPLT